jgi:hypothetical protein
MDAKGMSQEKGRANVETRNLGSNDQVTCAANF